MAEIDLNSLTIPSNYDPDKDTFLGTKVGELVVEKFVGRNEKYAQYYRCKCTHGGKYCKGYTYATKSHLVAFLNGKPGGTSSCGCVQKEMHENGDFHKIHDKHNTRIYAIYCGMKARCYNPNRPAYKDYGARGIRLCDEWLEPKNGFMNFYNWAMSNGYTDDMGINRINENGNYEPSNCEWILRSEDKSDKRTTHYEKYYFMDCSISQLMDYTVEGISYDTLKHRLNDSHMSVAEATRLPLLSNQKDKEKFIKENYINGKIVTNPFKFLDEFKFSSENRKRIATEIKKPSLDQLNNIVNSLPIAGEFLKGYSNVTFAPEELKGLKEPPKNI